MTNEHQRCNCASPIIGSASLSTGDEFAGSFDITIFATNDWLKLIQLVLAVFPKTYDRVKNSYSLILCCVIVHTMHCCATVCSEVLLHLCAYSEAYKRAHEHSAEHQQTHNVSFSNALFKRSLFTLAHSLPSLITTMVLKLSVATVALAALAGAVNYRRVTCPDGINTATNEAVSFYFSPKRTKTSQFHRR